MRSLLNVNRVNRNLPQVILYVGIKLGTRRDSQLFQKPIYRLLLNGRDGARALAHTIIHCHTECGDNALLHCAGLCDAQCRHHPHKASRIAHLFGRAVVGALSLALCQVYGAHYSPCLHIGGHHRASYVAQALACLRAIALGAEHIVCRDFPVCLCCRQLFHITFNYKGL